MTHLGWPVYIHLANIALGFILCTYLYFLSRKLTKGPVKAIYTFINIFVFFLAFSRIISFLIGFLDLPSDPWDFVQYAFSITAFLFLLAAAYKAFEASKVFGFAKSAFVQKTFEQK